MNKKKKIIRSYRRGKDYKKEENSEVANRILKSAGQHACRYCPPWENDNHVGNRKAKRGTKKPRYKNKRA